METLDSKILYHRAFCFSISPFKIKKWMEKGITINMPEYITEKVFCKALKINKKESKRMRDEGEVSYTQVKNKIYYRTKEVIELIFKNK